MDCTIEVRDVYGKSLIYPVDGNALLFAALTGKKTFSKYDMLKIEKLGFNIKAKVYGGQIIGINAEGL
jgi:hypothetical protein